jgi:hypothetical protein
MFRGFFVLWFLFGTLQSTNGPIVHRVFVRTPYNASVVFEYTNRIIPEGQPATPALVQCLISQLRATGMFSDLNVTLKPIGGGNVDVEILPVWSKLKDGFIVKEITIDGFTAFDQTLMIKMLERKGLKVGVPVLKYPLPSIRNMALESVREIYQSDSKRMYDAEEELSKLSFALEVVDSHLIRLRLTAFDTSPCQ